MCCPARRVADRELVLGALDPEVRLRWQTAPIGDTPLHIASLPSSSTLLLATHAADGTAWLRLFQSTTLRQVVPPPYCLRLEGWAENGRLRSLGNTTQMVCNSPLVCCAASGGAAEARTAAHSFACWAGAHSACRQQASCAG